MNFSIPDNWTFMLVCKDERGLLSMTDNDILLAGLLDATNPVCMRSFGRICTDQFREDLKRGIEKAKQDGTAPLYIRAHEDAERRREEQEERCSPASAP